MKARVENKKIVFSTPRSEQMFYEKFEGKDIEIQADDRESPELRRYFEGPVTWSWFYLHPQIAWRDFREAREDLKYQFNGYQSYTSKGQKITRANSTRMSKKHWMAFLDRIQDYYQENGYMHWFPDSNEFNNWINTAPGSDEIFPPLKALKDMYTEKKASLSGKRPWELAKPWGKSYQH